MSTVRRVSRRAAATAARKRIVAALNDDGDDSDSGSEATGGAPDRVEVGGDHESRKRARPDDLDGSGEEDAPPAAAAAPAPVVGERAPLPSRNARGELVFPDHPRFLPNLTPKQVLQAGSFGGGYFRPIHSSVVGQRVADDWKEFPADWFEGLDVPRQVTSPDYTEAVNRHGRSCGQGLDAWESSGWIRAQDPRGWFQWYCRFYLGRRTEDDERQISRWFGVAGPKGRWKRSLIKKCVVAGAPFDDANVSPVVRQTLLHWAYELTQADFDEFAKELTP